MVKNGETGMIIFRRAVAVLLTLVFVLLLFPLLFVYRVNSMVANPDFYVEQLRRADVYNFLYTDVLPKALEQATAPSPNVKGPDLSWVTPLVAPVARDIFPPAWLQNQTENSIRAVVPYIVGSRDSFSINIPLKDRVQAGAQSLKQAIRKPEFTNKVYDEVIVYVTSMVSSNSAGFPIPLDSNTVPAMVRRVLPPEWVVAQLDSAITEVTPYFVQDKEHFTVRIDLIGRVDDVQAVLTELLKKQETYT